MSQSPRKTPIQRLAEINSELQILTAQATRTAEQQKTITRKAPQAPPRPPKPTRSTYISRSTRVKTGTSLLNRAMPSFDLAEKEKKIQELQNQIAKFESARISFDKDKSDLNKRLLELEAKNREQHDKFSELEFNIQTQTEIESELRSKIQRLESQNMQYSTIESTLRAQIKDLEETYATMIDDLEDYEDMITSIPGVISISDSENCFYDYKLMWNSAWHLTDEGESIRAQRVAEDLLKALGK